MKKNEEKRRKMNKMKKKEEKLQETRREIKIIAEKSNELKKSPEN